MRPIYGYPEKSWKSTFPIFLIGFVSIDPTKVRTKFEVRIALPNPEIIGGTQKICAVPFLQIFNELLFRCALECIPAKFAVPFLR